MPRRRARPIEARARRSAAPGHSPRRGGQLHNSTSGCIPCMPPIMRRPGGEAKHHPASRRTAKAGRQSTVCGESQARPANRVCGRRVRLGAPRQVAAACFIPDPGCNGVPMTTRSDRGSGPPALPCGTAVLSFPLHRRPVAEIGRNTRYAHATVNPTMAPSWR